MIADGKGVYQAKSVEVTTQHSSRVAPSFSQIFGLPLRIRRKAQGENADAISSNPV